MGKNQQDLIDLWVSGDPWARWLVMEEVPIIELKHDPSPPPPNPDPVPSNGAQSDNGGDGSVV